MKKESPESQKRRLVEEAERLAEYALEDIVVVASASGATGPVRSAFRSKANSKGISFNQRVDLMNNAMFDLEELELEETEEQRRVSEALGEVEDPNFASPKRSNFKKYTFGRDLTVLQDEEKKERAKEGKDEKEPDSHKPEAGEAHEPDKPKEKEGDAEADKGKATSESDLEKHKDADGKLKKESTKHLGHDGVERARLALLHRSASGGTLARVGDDGELIDVKKGRAAMLAPRARRQTAATDPTQAAAAPAAAQPQAADPLAAMMAAMEEKAKQFRPVGGEDKSPGARRKLVPRATAASGTAQSAADSEKSDSKAPSASPSSATTDGGTTNATDSAAQPATAAGVAEPTQTQGPPPSDASVSQAPPVQSGEAKLSSPTRAGRSISPSPSGKTRSVSPAVGAGSASPDDKTRSIPPGDSAQGPVGSSNASGTPTTSSPVNSSRSIRTSSQSASSPASLSPTSTPNAGTSSGNTEPSVTPAVDGKPTTSASSSGRVVPETAGQST